jgi:hypothetical protein
MSLESLNAKMVKVGKKGGYVAEKIATYKSKKRRTLARARASVDGKHNAVVKIPKAIRTLLDCINENDLEQVARVYREAMNATTRMWDVNEKKLIEFPDHKTRVAAANMVAAYKEGLPVQRQIRLDAKFGELKDKVAAFKRSPAAQDFLLRLAAGEVFQEKGGEKQVENARVIEAETPVQESTDS